MYNIYTSRFYRSRIDFPYIFFNAFFIDEEFDEKETIFNGTNENTDLILIGDLEWVIQEEYLEGLIIEDRFQIGELLGDGFTGFVRSGRLKKLLINQLIKHSLILHIFNRS